jgi:hypothetical protein
MWESFLQMLYAARVVQWNPFPCRFMSDRNWHDGAVVSAATQWILWKVWSIFLCANGMPDSWSMGTILKSLLFAQNNPKPGFTWTTLIYKSTLLQLLSAFCIKYSSSSSAWQSSVDPGLLQKLLPVFSIHSHIPPILHSQSPNILDHAILPSQFGFPIFLSLQVWYETPS